MTKKSILVFGGNGFIGSEAVDHLLNFSKNEETEFDIVLVNRGSWKDWDHAERIRPRIVENIVCDRRKDSLKTCLTKYLTRESFVFEAIIDFSAYKAEVIRKVFEDIPSDKFKIYILISTDSIYEVCATKHDITQNLEESDCKRPESKHEQEKLKKLDDYGHHKLKCEELLIKYSAKNNIPYIILRLPDVLGERDSTDRFWFYQMWLQYLKHVDTSSTKHEILIPKYYFNKKTSYVYVKDVAKAIHLTLKLSIRNEIINVAYEMPVTLIELIKLIASFIDDTFTNNLNFVETNEENESKCISHGFPSVNKAPLNINKLKQLLKFEPSNMQESIEKIFKFYNEAYNKYPRNRKSIERDLIKEIKDIDEIKFKDFIKNKISS